MARKNNPLGKSRWERQQDKRENSRFRRDFLSFEGALVTPLRQSPVEPPQPGFAERRRRLERIERRPIERTRLVVRYSTWITAIRYFDSPFEAIAYVEAYQRRFSADFVSSPSINFTKPPYELLMMNPYTGHDVQYSREPFSEALMYYTLSPYGDFDWPFEGREGRLRDIIKENLRRSRNEPNTAQRITRKLALDYE